MENILIRMKFAILVLFCLISLKLISSKSHVLKQNLRLNQVIYSNYIKTDDNTVDSDNNNLIQYNEYSNSKENNQKLKNDSAITYNSFDLEEDDDFNSSEIVAMFSFYIITVLIIIITMLFINQKL